MSHYNVDYTTITDLEVRKAKAIQDIQKYLGGKRKFENIGYNAMLERVSRKGFIFQCAMFLGIEGYPAEAWADFLNLTD